METFFYLSIVKKSRKVIMIIDKLSLKMRSREMFADVHSNEGDNSKCVRVKM
jgi:hypothetical protein